MDNILNKIKERKEQLDTYKPLPSDLTKNLDSWLKVELTYTSNAIEGNTLTRAQTAQVIEKGLAVEGKTVIEHLEAENHAKAFEKIVAWAKNKDFPVTIGTILELHSTILQRIDDTNAGRFRTIPVRIAGSDVVMPNPAKVPQLMDEFISWLKSAQGDPVTVAADAHYRLVSIHPFVDGNGRTARLLMNLILMKEGFVPAIIRKEDRSRYIDSIEKAQLGGSLDYYYRLIYEAVDRSLDVYIETFTQKKKSITGRLLRIGEVANLAGEELSTIRHWINEGLIKADGYTKGGYQLFSKEVINTAKKIRELQETERFTLEEIREQLRA
jgi:Fic family protein